MIAITAVAATPLLQPSSPPLPSPPCHCRRRAGGQLLQGDGDAPRRATLAFGPWRRDAPCGPTRTLAASRRPSAVRCRAGAPGTTLSFIALPHAAGAPDAAGRGGGRSAPPRRDQRRVEWADKLIEQEICEKTAPKLRAFLLHPTKAVLFRLELITVVHAGKPLKARNTSIEGDTFEFITAYDTISRMGDAIKSPMTPELRAELQKLAEANGGAPANPFAAPAVAAPAPAASILQILTSLSTTVFKTVNLSVAATFWDWHGETHG